MNAAQRPMRRGEREIRDREGVEEALRGARTLFLGLNGGEVPYVVPVSFGYGDGALWVHSAAAGTKIDLLRRDPRVAFAAECGTEIVAGRDACGWSVRSRSVTGTGIASVVEDEAGRRRGLEEILRHYGWDRPEAPEFGADALSRTAVIRIEVTRMRGKRFGKG